MPTDQFAELYKNIILIANYSKREIDLEKTFSVSCITL